MDRSTGARILAIILAALLLSACGGASPATGGNAGAGASGSPADQMKALTKNLDDAIASLKANDVPGAKAAYDKFDKGWDKVEDGVKAKSKDAYAKIEDGMTDVKAALVIPATPDTAKAIAAIEKLDKTVDDLLPSLK